MGISANAVKTRVKKMVAKGIIQKFIVMVNPVIFGYEKQFTLIVRNIDQIIAKKEGYVFNQLNLLGDVLGYVKQLGGDTIFLLLGSSEAEDKIELSKVAREIKSYSVLCSQNVKTRQLTLKLS